MAQAATVAKRRAVLAETVVARARQTAVPVVTEELQTEAQPMVVMLAAGTTGPGGDAFGGNAGTGGPGGPGFGGDASNGGNSDGGNGGNGASACEGPDSCPQAQPSTL